ncbi:hypothetical protein DL765_009614 [Monosporascus sp. GIB2]|nr:hypothetical protein DL765_009614 [Monosporascus sp. GIB2]
MTPRSWSTGYADLLRNWTGDLGMFDEVPDKDPYRTDPVDNKQVRDYKHTLDLLAVVMTEVPPKWSRTEYGVGLIGFPFNAIPDWPIGTQSGYAFFPKAQYVTTTGEDMWLSSEALLTIATDANVTGEKELAFDEIFECDPASDPA